METPTKSRTPRPYQGTPVLQPDGSYNCPSDTITLGYYNVRLEDDRRWSCTCPFFGYDSLTCKHIIATVQLQEKPRVSLVSLFEGLGR